MNRAEGVMVDDARSLRASHRNELKMTASDPFQSLSGLPSTARSVRQRPSSGRNRLMVERRSLQIAASPVRIFSRSSQRSGDQFGGRESGFSRERRSVHPAARANSSKNAMS